MHAVALPPIAQVFNEETRDQATTVVIAVLSIANGCKKDADKQGHFRVNFGDIVTEYPGYPAPDAHAQLITNVSQLAPEFGLKMIGGSDLMGYAFQITP
jgi:hypothetical protein